MTLGLGGWRGLGGDERAGAGSYALEDTSKVKALVTSKAGVGKLGPDVGVGPDTAIDVEVGTGEDVDHPTTARFCCGVTKGTSDRTRCCATDLMNRSA